jgi:2-dehydro-3-deoxygluconokinase
MWQAEGVDTSAVACDTQAPTGLYFVNHGPQGHSFSYLRAGSAASRMLPQTMDLSAASRTKWLHVSGISQAISAGACDTVFAAIEAARAAGGKVSFDPNLRLSLWPLARARATICATMALTDLFLPSLDEAVALAGTEDVAAIFAWARSHGARCGAEGRSIRRMVRRAGRRAATGRIPPRAGRGRHWRRRLLRRLAAGRLAAGDTLADAVRYANASAGLSTLGHGAVAPIPTAAQVRAALG